MSGNGRDWAILNASPDLRAQLAACAALHPTGPRESPVRAVLLTNGDIDHVAGLLTLRERQAFTLFATAEILGGAGGEPGVRGAGPERWCRGGRCGSGRRSSWWPGVEAELFAVPGKVPLYLEGETVATDLEGEQTVGRADRAARFYVPGCARGDAGVGGAAGGARRRCSSTARCGRTTR